MSPDPHRHGRESPQVLVKSGGPKGLKGEMLGPHTSLTHGGTYFTGHRGVSSEGFCPESGKN